MRAVIQGSCSQGVRRSVKLLKGFRIEQTDPDRFYDLVAHDLVDQLSAYVDVMGRRVLDVGAGRPQFARAFRRLGAGYLGVDPDVAELEGLGREGLGVVASRGESLAIRTASVDVALAINVFEHVRRPELLGAELARVTRPGGVIVVSYTNWLSPWGGHETSPFHYLGGRWAVRRYRRHYGHPAKNRLGETAFKVSVADGLRWARNQPGVTLLDARPRYHPSWMRGVVRIPGLREIATWNLLLVLRRS